MKHRISRRVIVLVAFLVLAFAGVLAMVQRIYDTGLQTRNLGQAVFAYAARYDRMPDSLEQMVEAGYAQPADRAGVYRMRIDPAQPALEPPVTVGQFEVAWGIQPDQLVEGKKGVFKRGEPDSRVLLVRHTDPPLIVRALGGRMAMAFPVELYRELTGTATPQTAPAAASSMPQPAASR